MWGRGEPSPAMEPGWDCPAGRWSGQSGDTPSLHSQEPQGSLPALETCTCGLVASFKLFQTEKKKKKEYIYTHNCKTRCSWFAGGTEGLG